MKNKITVENGPNNKKNKRETDAILTRMNNGEDGIVQSQEISELQGSLQELNNDEIDTNNRTSGIDLRTRLYNTEIASITVLDTLVQFKFLPISIVPFTLQKKRLAVSLKGKGREEIVSLVRGKREEDQAKSTGGLFGNMFKKKDE